MDSHLNDDQIAELLRLTLSRHADSGFGRGIQEESQLHLKSCESCQARVLDFQKATEQLAILRTDMLEPPSPQCPPEDVWISVAAGIDSPGSDRYLQHAASCDHCGQLLNLAAADFAFELTAQEELQIADLASSAAGWQTSLAARLHAAQSVPPPASPLEFRWRSSLTTLLTPSRLAFAAALVGLIVLGFLDYRLKADLSAQNQRSADEIHRLEQNVSQQSSQIAELTTEFWVPNTSAAGSKPQPIGGARVASLVLEAGLTRGIGESKRLAIPRGADIAEITLHLVESPVGVLREDLVTADGQTIWSQELSASESERKTKALSLLVPAYLLTPNDYQILVAHQSSSGLERLAGFTFRVTR
jgi:hypothetical protein